jgi:2-methylcitrate dehydratase PrpD
MSATQRGVTSKLADYAINAQLSDLPGPVRHETLRSLLNIVGCTIGGSRHEAVAAAERGLLPFAGAPQSTLVGRKKKSDAITAAFVNCLSSSIYTFDDTHAEALVHPSGPTMGAVLAVAEMKPVTGSELLIAFMLGVEMSCRLSKAVSVAPAHGRIAWSQTGITGAIGSAIAAGRLLKFNESQMRQAIGIAAMQAGGIRAVHGTMGTACLPAHASASGLRSAVLAQAGFTSTETSIEARYGFAECFAETPALSWLENDLGKRFEILSNTYKPYPCGIVIHPMIDGCLELHRTNKIDPSAIERISIRCHPTALAITNRPHPTTEFEAQVSLFHWIAVSLLRGAAGIQEGVDAAVNDPSVVRIRALIDVTTDATISHDGADVSIRMRDGRDLNSKIRSCIGSKDRPMTDLELEQKFEIQARDIIGSEQARSLISRCWNIDQENDTAAFVRALG